MIRLDNISKQIGHQIRLACHFFETLPATAIVARAGAANGKFAERLAAFETAKQTLTSSGR